MIPYMHHRQQTDQPQPCSHTCPYPLPAYQAYSKSNGTSQMKQETCPRFQRIQQRCHTLVETSRQYASQHLFPPAFPGNRQWQTYNAFLSPCYPCVIPVGNGIHQQIVFTTLQLQMTAEALVFQIGTLAICQIMPKSHIRMPGKCHAEVTQRTEKSICPFPSWALELL